MSSSAGPALYQSILWEVNKSKSTSEFSVYVVKHKDLFASGGREALAKSLGQSENGIENEDKLRAVRSLAQAVSNSSDSELEMKIIEWGEQNKPESG